MLCFISYTINVYEHYLLVVVNKIDLKSETSTLQLKFKPLHQKNTAKIDII